MPSPFPGMDPYLENPRHWRDVHQTLIVYLRTVTLPFLPAEYAARIGERVFIEEVTLGREPFLEIVRVQSPERVVAVIEVLSPTSKLPGSGRDEYLRKQAQLRQSETHLLEIDLLRGGPYTLAAPESEVRQLVARWDYLISLHRTDSPRPYQTWPVTVRDTLPVVRLPLSEGLPDVPLDLQTVLTRAYDESGFRRNVDYTGEPIPPLPAEDADWANSVLEVKGLR